MSSIRKNNLKFMVIYFGLTLFSVLFTSIYYLNSYGMTDVHMTFLFLPPLIATVIFSILFAANYETTNWGRYLFNMSFPFIYIYMILTGIYTIAKTFSSWLFIYLIIAGLGYLGAIITEIVLKNKAKKQTA